MKGTLFAIFAMLLVGAGTLAMAACGGGDDDDGTSDAITAEETSAATESTSSAAEATTGEEPTTVAATAADGGNGNTKALAPCELLTQDEISAALGEDVQDPVVVYTGTANVGNSQAAVGTCNYVSPSGLSSISLTSWFSEDDGAIQDMIELACNGKEMIDLGDLACWYDSGHGEIQLGKGGAFIDMFITSSNDTTEIGQTLAEKAVARL